LLIICKRSKIFFFLVLVFLLLLIAKCTFIKTYVTITSQLKRRIFSKYLSFGTFFYNLMILPYLQTVCFFCFFFKTVENALSKDYWSFSYSILYLVSVKSYKNVIESFFAILYTFTRVWEMGGGGGRLLLHRGLYNNKYGTVASQTGLKEPNSWTEKNFHGPLFPSLRVNYYCR